jgi:hypothetical protein
LEVQVLDVNRPAAAAAAGGWSGDTLPFMATDPQMARFFRRSPRTIKRWRAKGLLPPQTIRGFSARDAVEAHFNRIAAQREAA